MKIKKRLLSFILIGCVLCGSLVPSFSVAAAPLANLAQIASYVASAIGLVNVTSNGGVSKASGSVMDSIKEWVSDNFGTGIYKDSEGNYIFSDGATQELFDSLTYDPSVDARTVANFGGSSYDSVLPYYYSSYVNNSFREAVYNAIMNTDDFDHYMCEMVQSRNSDSVTTYFTIRDISNLGYFYISESDSSHFVITPRNLDGNSISMSGISILQTYHISYDTFDSPSRAAFNNNSGFELYYYNGGSDNNNLMSSKRFDNVTLLEYADELSQNFWYYRFPFNGIFFANRSVIIGKTSAYGMALANQSTGLMYVNTSIPTVSETVINNNDWNSIYNSYVTSVSNNYNSDMDISQLRDLMYTYTNVITDSIDSGISDIESVILDTNGWLQRIYEKLGVLQSLLENSDSSEDYTTALSRIESRLSDIIDNTDSLSQLSTYLSQLVSNSNSMVDYLRKIASGNGSPSIPEGWDVLPDMPNPDILDTISDMSVLVTALFNVVPFCFVTMFGTLISLIAHDPITPVFDIPIEFSNSFINVSETLSIDLSLFDDIRPLVCAFWYILFIVVLLYATFKFFIFLNDFFFG